MMENDTERRAARQQIRVGNRQLRDMLRDCTNALLRSNSPPKIVILDGKLKRVYRPDGGPPVLERLSPLGLSWLLCEAADFVTTRTVSGRQVSENVFPPVVPTRILMRPSNWPAGSVGLLAEAYERFKEEVEDFEIAEAALPAAEKFCPLSGPPPWPFSPTPRNRSYHEKLLSLD